jgi:hypothetical protein
MNVIPQGQISQAAKIICSYVPTPNITGAGINNNFHSLSAPNWPYFNTYTPLIKLDHSFSDKEKLSVSYTNQIRHRIIVGSGFSQSPAWGAGDVPIRSTIITIRLPIAGRCASMSIPSSLRQSAESRHAFWRIVTSTWARMEPTGKTGTQKLGIRHAGRQWILSAISFSGGINRQRVSTGRMKKTGTRCATQLTRI